MLIGCIYFVSILYSILYSVDCSHKRIVKYYPHIQKNARQHNTINYQTISEGSGQLVLRRGQIFIMEFELSASFDDNIDDFVVIATPVNSMMKNYKAHQEYWLFQWDYINTLLVDIYIPVNASVGRWHVKCILKKQNSTVALTRNIIEEEIIVLFNPWNEGDSVYLPKEAERQEYVLNDMGEIYMGHPKKRYSKPWYFGQFEHSTFMAVLFIIEKYSISIETRKNVVTLSRAFTSLVNSNDNLGVLVGRWDGKYEPHKHPMSWVSSGPILQQYHKTNGSPVRYGQCWVYAGVLTTMCRAIGIPSRPVTDFGAAHDKNKNMIIDKYFKMVNGKPVEISTELIWNFHVWNEAFMKRPDLNNSEYDGWQVIDGTPQETSNGLYRNGPTPPRFAKYGEMKLNYDGPFLYSEVNADIVNWLQDPIKDKVTRMSSNKMTIGQSIITKSPAPTWDGHNRITYENLVSNYKFHEGSEQERQYYYKAVEQLNLTETLAVIKDIQGRAIKDDIELNVTLLTSNEPLIGEQLKFNVTFTNKKNTSIQIYVTVSVSSVYYYGKVSKSILNTPDMVFNLESKQTKYYDVELHASEYIDKLVEFAMVKVDVLAHGKMREDFWHEERSIQFQKPKLDVVVQGDAIVNEPITLDIKFDNPLNLQLSNCTLNIEGQGLKSQKPITVITIGSKERYHTMHSVITSRNGSVQFVLNLNCDQLHDIFGDLIVPVS